MPVLSARVERRHPLSPLGALAAAPLLLAGVVLAGGAAAQPFGYYPAPGHYAYHYAPPRAYDANGNYTAFVFFNGVDFSDPVPGTGLLAPEILARAPYDRYGPDPNGLIAVDGHMIYCRLVQTWSGTVHRYLQQRECW
jgi:hypothetical protein